MRKAPIHISKIIPSVVEGIMTGMGKRQRREKKEKEKRRRNGYWLFEAKVAVKSRAVDPYFSSEGGLKRLSEADESWKKVLAEESKPKEYFLQFCD